MPKIKKATPPSSIRLVKVGVDSRCAALDRIVPKYETGQLCWDVTNGMYCTLKNGECPEWLSLFDLKGTKI